MDRFLLQVSKLFLIPVFILISSFHLRVINRPDMPILVAILWADGNPQGEIILKYGSLEKLRIANGSGKIQANRFSFKSAGGNRLEISFKEYSINPGSGSTLVSIRTAEHPFSFFLRDVNSNFPIYIPQYQVIVVPGENKESYDQVKKSIDDKKLSKKLQTIESAKEESFESASAVTRDQSCPTWLGLGRDIRLFQVDYARKNDAHEYELITPRMAGGPVRLKELNNDEAIFAFATGRGQGPVLNSTRRLEDGILPILHTTLMDDDITYSSICFVSLEQSPLTAGFNKGTNYLIADQYSVGHMFTQSQQESVDQLLKKENPDQEVPVLYFRVIAQNTASVPRYSWFKAPRPGRGWWSGFNWKFNSMTGFSQYQDSMVYCISSLNGKPLHDEEIAVLLQPGEQAQFEFYIPHIPISRERAAGLAKQSFDERYRESRLFWQKILDTAQRISLPDKRIEEMMYAGLLHLDLVTYGTEPEGTLAPAIGVYSPIGTESSPIIQFYNSMGWEDVARRSLQYFLDKQHNDGMIQNFGGYMVETGAALWTMGEYYRYARNREWLQTAKPGLLKACEFLTNWRKQNLSDSLKGKGYGMIAGKVADPNDDYHQFMLNAYGYLGMRRVAEMLKDIDPVMAERIGKEAAAWRSDIRESFFNSMANSPVVPLGNGSWCPTVAPWTESSGPQALYVDAVNSYSHGTFTVRDVLLGPLYLIFCEVLDPEEEASKMMLDYHTELFYQHNAAFSQPYYSRHAWLELKLGLVKPFLKTYYTTFSSLADRETYTFWEHIYHVSPHKTHEEAWFLMETRWMLYLEDGDTLHLLPGMPRSWLEDGKKIKLENVASYFGQISFEVKSNIKEGSISAIISCNTQRKPSTIIIRVPHPEYIKAKSVSGGVYDPVTESVTIEHFTGEAAIEIQF